MEYGDFSFGWWLYRFLMRFSSSSWTVHCKREVGQVSHFVWNAWKRVMLFDASYCDFCFTTQCVRARMYWSVRSSLEAQPAERCFFFFMCERKIWFWVWFVLACLGRWWMGHAFPILLCRMVNSGKLSTTATNWEIITRQGKGRAHGPQNRIGQLLLLPRYLESLS